MDKSDFVGAIWNPESQAMGLERNPATHAFANRHINLCPSCEPSSNPWTNPGPSWTWSRVPWINCHRQSPMNDKAFVKVQVSSREVPGYQWGKKMSLDSSEMVRGTVWLYLHHLSPKVVKLRAMRYPLGPWSHPIEESESTWISTCFLRCMACSQRSSFLSCPIQSAE